MSGSRAASASTALTGAGRAARVGLLGGGSLLLATAAHVSGGGSLPGPGVLVVAGFVLGLVALLLTRRRVRLPVVLATLVPQQVALHVLLDAAASAAGGCTPVQAAHHAMATLTCMPTHGMGPMGYAWPMFVGHVVATLGTAWLLARGEAWCWRLAERVTRAALVQPGARPSRRRARPVVEALVGALPRRTPGPHGSRAPPLSFA
ncbi:hypothetical protein [Microlunatus flavus]|uniref:Uncharacterized protein n=1 Tax=Microlunatus flavus TaxID=1036181 RepID=A0A1H8ZUD6_9ACTN|nr:hypothetical protein [Microlunatus flavus]SEP68039.1 hypothetical protein SAMN05421756_101365 [Microlunatus flavus]